MADVGRLAGVSPTAVSFVINGRVGEISDVTRSRVLAAVQELGYRPNRAARGLRTRRTHIVGVVSDPVDDVCAIARAVAGAHDAAAEHGSRLMLAHDRGGQGLRSVVEDLLDRQVDALMIAVRGARLGRLPAGGSVPTVLLNVPTGGSGTPAVLPDERQGCRSATELLLAARHRRIALLVGPPRSWPTSHRLAGHRAALAAAGVPYDPALVLCGPDRADTGYLRTRRAIAAEPRPTALLCGTDRVAAGAYLALAEAGLQVPRDMSVLGYDDGPGLATELRPALSTVHLPFYEMGRFAVQRLLLPAPHPEGRVHLPCSVVSRGSVAAPSRGDPAR